MNATRMCGGLALLVVGVSVLWGQEAELRSGIRLSMRTGYTSYQTEKLDEILGEAETFYQEYGLRTAKLLHRPQPFIAGEMMVVSGSFRFVGGYSGGMTGGYASHKDNGGELRIASEMRVRTFYAGVDVSSAGDDVVKHFIGIRFGSMSASWKYRERLTVWGYPDIGGTYEVQARAKSAVTELITGVDVTFWSRYTIGADAGYRVTGALDLKDNVGRFKIKVGAQGWRWALRLGVLFRSVQ